MRTFKKTVRTHTLARDIRPTLLIAYLIKHKYNRYRTATVTNQFWL